jgi:hypothetical protein
LHQQPASALQAAGVLQQQQQLLRHSRSMQLLKMSSSMRLRQRLLQQQQPQSQLGVAASGIVLTCNLQMTMESPLSSTRSAQHTCCSLLSQHLHLLSAAGAAHPQQVLLHSLQLLAAGCVGVPAAARMRLLQRLR